MNICTRVLEFYHLLYLHPHMQNPSRSKCCFSCGRRRRTTRRTTLPWPACRRRPCLSPPFAPVALGRSDRQRPRRILRPHRHAPPPVRRTVAAAVGDSLRGLVGAPQPVHARGHLHLQHAADAAVATGSVKLCSAAAVTGRQDGRLRLWRVFSRSPARLRGGREL